MKVAIVNTLYGAGGAARVAKDAFKAVSRKGWESVFLTAQENIPDSNVYSINSYLDWFIGRASKTIGFPDMINYCASRFIHLPEIVNSDIVHFHNLHGFYFGLYSLPHIVKHKKCVWTLHDVWPLTGGCYYPMGCEQYQKKCSNCPRKGEYPMSGWLSPSKTMFSMKRKIIQRLGENIQIISPSTWLAELVKEANLIPEKNIHVINNAVDTNIFHPDSRMENRQKLGLHEGEIGVLLLSASLADKRKGGYLAAQALKQISPSVRKSMHIFAVGNEEQNPLDLPADLKVKKINYISSTKQLAELYSSMDVFIMPSLADNYPMTVIESLSCGTPVIAFASGGIPEQIQHGKTGYLIEHGNVDDFAKALEHFVTDTGRHASMRHECRKYTMEFLTIERFVNQHLDIYNSLF